MKKGKLMGKIFGIALVCVMVGVTFGGLLSAVEYPQVQASSDWEIDNGFTGVDTESSQQYNTLPSPAANSGAVNQEAVSEDPFDYQGEYVIDQTELNDDEKTAQNGRPIPLSGQN